MSLNFVVENCRWLEMTNLDSIDGEMCIFHFCRVLAVTGVRQIDNERRRWMVTSRVRFCFLRWWIDVSPVRFQWIGRAEMLVPLNDGAE